MLRAILFFALAASFAPIQCFGQSDESTIDGLEWNARVGDEEAEFIFPSTGRTKFSWHNADTPDNRLEYSWSIDVSEKGSGYQFGASLFHYSEAPSDSGTLGELLDACQHDLWEVSKDGGDNIGSIDNADIVDQRVRIKLDKALIRKIFADKPEHVVMQVVMPNCTITKKVPVKYQK